MDLIFFIFSANFSTEYAFFGLNFSLTSRGMLCFGILSVVPLAFNFQSPVWISVLLSQAACVGEHPLVPIVVKYSNPSHACSLFIKRNGRISIRNVFCSSGLCNLHCHACFRFGGIFILLILPLNLACIFSRMAIFVLLMLIVKLKEHTKIFGLSFDLALLPKDKVMLPSPSKNPAM